MGQSGGAPSARASACRSRGDGAHATRGVPSSMLVFPRDVSKLLAWLGVGAHLCVGIVALRRPSGLSVHRLLPMRADALRPIRRPSCQRDSVDRVRPRRAVADRRRALSHVHALRPTRLNDSQPVAGDEPTDHACAFTIFSGAFRAQFHADAVAATGSVELYACRDGDETESESQRTVTTPAHFNGDSQEFELTEGWHATVTATT